MIEKVFFELVCFANWKLVEAYEDQVTIKSGDRQLFDFDTEEWIPALSTTIILRRNSQYQIISGNHLSFYEREVLDLYGYKRVK